MPASTRTTRTGSCASCGAYGNTPHRPTCTPDRVIRLSVMRRARRDSRNSAAVRANDRVQHSLLLSL